VIASKVKVKGLDSFQCSQPGRLRSAYFVS
jgi:hypothetical protein